MASLSPADTSIRQSYTDAFNESLTVCTIVAAISLVVSLFTFRKNPKTMEESRKERMLHAMEMARAVRKPG